MIATNFYKGETVLLSIEVRSKISNVLIDPTSVLLTITKNKIRISDEEVLELNDVSMSKTGVGKYYYNYDSNEVGTYMVTYKAINDSKITILKDSFSVIN